MQTAITMECSPAAPDRVSRHSWRDELARLIRWQSAQYMGRDRDPRLASAIGAAVEILTGPLE